MRVLLIHPNFPAQLRHVARALGAGKDNVVVFATRNPRHEWAIPGVSKALYVTDDGEFKVHRLAEPVQDAVLQGEAMYRLGHRLRSAGFTPDVIYANSGWGSTLYLKDVWPDVPLMCYFEWFYDPQGSDALYDVPPVAGDAAPPPKLLRTRNAAIFNDLWNCEQGLSPTHWQKSQFPAEYQGKIAVLHDGVDTTFFSPVEGARMRLPKLDLSGVDEIVTFAGRGMEPYRGFPQFMVAIEKVLRERPQAHAVIVGADRVCYGSPHPSGRGYKDIMLERLDLPMERVHFTGALPYGAYRDMLRASSVHVYLTRPFVLSWSSIESMACGCCIVGSDTEPVREAMTNGHSALLVDFRDPSAIAEGIVRVLEDRELAARLRKGAREVALERYSLERLLPRHLELIANTARRGPVVGR
ncbi:glycosyltransferase involved in cell wall biosynthesis [Desulfobaculum xiamenense]|uniref:Glycosyltransferase involved in cell wall biosynthesis n=1 Tax=Desulfobaculum xiamenense TaxID=995050 RepID=A0A846QPV3_9BACT|nr:glycosyltransferase [Desulfobaculum xiamenense]NJB67435.1 glycosyltransferase involved in cell wall biosynthesis [Desulfobaculum xiamenense]